MAVGAYLDSTEALAGFARKLAAGPCLVRLGKPKALPGKATHTQPTLEPKTEKQLGELWARVARSFAEAEASLSEKGRSDFQRLALALGQTPPIEAPPGLPAAALGSLVSRIFAGGAGRLWFSPPSADQVWEKVRGGFLELAELCDVCLRRKAETDRETRAREIAREWELTGPGVSPNPGGKPKKAEVTTKSSSPEPVSTLETGFPFGKVVVRSEVLRRALAAFCDPEVESFPLAEGDPYLDNPRDLQKQVTKLVKKAKGHGWAPLKERTIRAGTKEKALFFEAG